MKEVIERSLVATDDEVRGFLPSEFDMSIAEAMVSGAINFKEIAEHLGCDPAKVSGQLRNPVAAAWIHRTIHKMVEQRLGAVDAAMLAQAISGNVNAAKLMYSRYKELATGGSIHIHAAGGVDIDFNQVDDKTLDAMIEAEVPAAKDVDFTVKEDDESAD